ncbi:MAG TPA: AMP-binding protein [Candidatus Binatia bacterium]|nr:AMP-binding protein [Candidatus Binatia bacterium]
MESPQKPPYTKDRHLGAIFFRRVAELGDRPFVKLQRNERFEEISWRDFGAMVQKVLLALYAIGLAPGERVAIVGENSLQWLCADLATLAGGLPNVIVAPTLSDVMLLRILGHSRCRAAFVQNPTGVGRLLNLKSQLPALSHIVVMEGAASHLPDTVSFAQLVERGARVEEARLFEILESVHGNDLATIMYTSGSTGEPKGVMRTQDNLLSNISNGGAIVRAAPEELFIIVLSLNHLFGRFGFLKSAVTGRTTAIIEATELELNVKLLERLAGTSLAVVPRVMERIWQSMLEEDGNGELWERLETLDRKKTERAQLDDDQSRQFDELRATLKNIVQKSLGGRIKYMSYAGAAMPPRIMRFFELIGIPLIGSYGSTECGGVTLSGIGDTKPGSLGKPFPNCELQIAEDGELLVRGPTVTPGYFENPEATREAIDAEGWFHTGDLGTIDADGCLFISGRKKDIFNCSDGSNIYPGYIELLLENEPFVRQAILLGDRRPFIAALIVPDKKKIAGELHKENAALTEREIATALQSRIDQLNQRLEQFEKVRRFAVMRDDFSDEVRTVTVFQKIKVDRKAVEQRYQKEIDEIYGLAEEGRA